MSNTVLSQKILKLRNEGKTYQEIKTILNCSKGTIAYYCGEGQKEKIKNKSKRYSSSISGAKRKLQGFVYDYCSESARKSGNKGSLKETKISEVLKIIGENPVCYLTGEKINLEDKSSYSFDHKIPISRGGNRLIENLGLASKKANQAKYNMTPEEFIEFCKKVLIHNGYQVYRNIA